jgi:hypothetical protein
MKKSTKAALVSVLVFPGTGHMFVLRRPLRGLPYLVLALMATVFLVDYTLERSLSMMDRIASGEVALEPAAIREMLDEPPPRKTALMLQASGFILAGCWILGGLDAYILGGRSEENPGD